MNGIFIFGRNFLKQAAIKVNYWMLAMCQALGWVTSSHPMRPESCKYYGFFRRGRGRIGQSVSLIQGCVASNREQGSEYRPADPRAFQKQWKPLFFRVIGNESLRWSRRALEGSFKWAAFFPLVFQALSRGEASLESSPHICISR